MAYKLMLLHGLSYSGIVSATMENPIVSVASQEIADEAVKTGYFKLIESSVEEEIEEGADKEAVSFSYTEADLKKLSKTEQETIISTLAKDEHETKNEKERIELILQLQEQES